MTRLGVWLVVKLWCVMPLRAKVWAFMNDDIDGPEAK